MPASEAEICLERTVEVVISQLLLVSAAAIANSMEMMGRAVGKADRENPRKKSVVPGPAPVGS